MVRTLLGLIAGAGLSAATVSAQMPFKSALHDYRAVTVVDSLVQPWSIAFLPGGDTGR